MATTVPPIVSNLSTAKFREYVLRSLQAGVEITNDTGAPVPVIEHNSGANGGTFINSTTTYNGNWYAIQVLTNATFTTLSFSSNGWTGDSISGYAFPAGTTIFGNFSTIKLASGSVIAYTA